MDFTESAYYSLLNALQQQGFSFLTFDEFTKSSYKKIIGLRHDVDALPGNSLQFARIQSKMGIKGTYYFRIVPESFDEKIIREIYSLGHEIGYHYEDLTIARQKTKVKRQKAGSAKTFDLHDRKTAGPQDNEHLEKELCSIAIECFKQNLAKLREIVPVKTICMHGSPLSKWDSRLLWKYYDYHDFGIVGEPYLDINFDEVLYLTDTGRRWDGDSVNIRDKSEGGRRKAEGEKRKDCSPSAFSTQPSASFPRFHSTFDIIRAAEEGKLPDKIMMTFHPQRWTDKPMPWLKELIWQNTKNVGKFFLKKVRSR